MAAVTATGTGSQSGREARRRRILERGSDRLALITGQIQSLPPYPEQSAPQTSLMRQTSSGDSTQPEDNAVFGSTTLDRESHKEPSHCHILTKTDEPLPLNDDKSENTSSREPGEPLATLDRDNSINPSSREIEEPPTLNGNKRQGITSRAAAFLGIEGELSQISSSNKNPPQHNQRAKSLHTPHTTAQIRTAISSTENTRICSSAAAAVLVILSLTRFPILGSPGVRNILLLRPCYLLLLTNTSIVLARLIALLGATDSRTRQSSQGSAVGAGKAIEVGLMLQSTLAALSMDFGIYAILLICGHSLIQRFGR